MAAPANQNVALLWMSTLSWETPDLPGFNPAEDFFSRADAPQPNTREDRGDFIIADLVVGDQNGETHTFRVLPKRAFGRRCACALLTLSIKRGALNLPVARDTLQQTWEIARKTRFSDESPA
jgi:hypothetical protein